MCGARARQPTASIDAPRGLIHFKPAVGGPWADWRNWPHANNGSDSGSDVLCMSFALAYHFELNWTNHRDFDHGAQRSLIEMLKDCQVHEFFLLMVVSWNLPNGPDKNDVRWCQILTACEQIKKKHTARSMVLSGAGGALSMIWALVYILAPSGEQPRVDTAKYLCTAVAKYFFTYMGHTCVTYRGLRAELMARFREWYSLKSELCTHMLFDLWLKGPKKLGTPEITPQKKIENTSVYSYTVPNIGV